MLRADDKVGVVLVDRAGLCAGATGAGQGYLWLAHRDPAANIAAWELASRSVKLWQELMGSAPRVREQTEYRVLGSMLIATCAEDADALKCHAGKLRDAGIADVTYYTASMAQDVEPMLTLPSDGAAIVVPTDAQIDGRATTSMFLELISAQFNKVSNRFEAIYHDECRSLVADPSTGRISGVETGSGTRIMATHGVIVAAGAWSGDFLSRELENAKWKDVLRARKGHLVEIPGSEIPRPKGYDASNRPLLRHGLMEFGYSNHYRSHPVENSNSEGVDVTFTATTSASGSLLLGSSRQFVQQFPACHTDAFTSDADVVTAIIEEARQFIPSLTPPLHECLKVANVRVGPRPYSSTGMPLIGPVPDTPGLFLAAGHEGSGLTLCLATAEIIVDYVLGDQTQGTNDNKRNFIDVLRPRTL